MDRQCQTGTDHDGATERDRLQELASCELMITAWHQADADQQQTQDGDGGLERRSAEQDRRNRFRDQREHFQYLLRSAESDEGETSDATEHQSQLP